MDWNNPILYPAFFAPYLMFEHRHLRPQTPLNEDIKRDFMPMTVSPRQSAETSPDISSPVSDTYELLLSIRDVLSTLLLDSEGEVIGVYNMFIDPVAEEKENENE